MEEILYNVKLAGQMKNQVLKDITDIFEYCTRAEYNEELTCSIGSCILALMLLGRRSGVDLNKVMDFILQRANMGMTEGHLFETRFHDLSNIVELIRRE